MARLIDAAATASEHIASCERTDAILPSERQCDNDGAYMTLRTVSCAHAHERIHTCPECGYERRYGGPS
jgi:predicted RNA-binding Zn-ribbon protein involved in translation (DUF1610 family)